MSILHNIIDHIRSCLCLVLLMGWISMSAVPATLDEVLPELDRVISESDYYKRHSEARIDSMVRRMNSVSGRSRIVQCEDIAKEYSEINIDSAISYFVRARALLELAGDSAAVQRLFFESVSLLPVMGVMKESLDSFEAVVPDDIMPENKVYYYKAGHRLLFNVGSFYPAKSLRNKYLEAGMSMTDSLVCNINQDIPDYKLYRAQLSFMRGDTPTMVSDVHDLMELLPVEDSRYAQAAYMLGMYYDRKEKSDEAAYYLALAAISDIKSGRSCGTSLQALGMVLNKRGDIDRAYLCLTHALASANESKSMMRAVAASEALPVIARTFYDQDRSKLTLLTWLLIVIGLASLVIVGFIIWLRHEMTRLERMKSRLAESNKVKETYIGQFLSLCSIYMEKQEEFHKLVSRKIAAGQVEDLYAMVKSGKILDEQERIFYDVFDDVFMHMYPTFIDDVNALMADDRRIVLSDDGRLNTELRILAFMRLGIDDSAKVARFLGLSLNTIYTYRNKLKSRALRRDEFEADVMRIGQIE